MLAELVKAGKLPPVDERLPVNPRTIPVVEEIGQYGDTWYRVAVGATDPGILSNRLSYETLLRWNEDGSGVIANVAESYEVNGDATEMTFKLRQGMKWSDGSPFTSDDLMFVYNDILLNTDLTPSYPSWMKDPKGEPCVMEKIDDYTIKFSFKNPYGLFVQMLAGPSADWLTDRPKAYLSQFHPNYVEQAKIDEMTKAANFEQWIQLFGQKANWQNPEQPHIGPGFPPACRPICQL